LVPVSSLGQIFLLPTRVEAFVPLVRTALARQCGVEEDYCSKHYWKKQGCWKNISKGENPCAGCTIVDYLLVERGSVRAKRVCKRSL
jgi:hypothetical protein